MFKVETHYYDTSLVVAAGYAFSNQAEVYATVVKLIRIPISFIFTFAMALKGYSFILRHKRLKIM